MSHPSFTLADLGRPNCWAVYICDEAGEPSIYLQLVYTEAARDATLNAIPLRIGRQGVAIPYDPLVRPECRREVDPAAEVAKWQRAHDRAMASRRSA